MRIFGGSKSAMSGALALALGCAASALHAQSAPDFSIPSARPTANPRAQGPIDAENPYIRPNVPAPSPSPVPVPVPVPLPVPSPVPAPRPASSNAPPRSVPPPRTDAAPRLAPAPGDASAVPSTTAPAANPLPSGVAPLPTLAATDSFEVPSAPAQPQAPADAGWPWPWLAGGAALIAALAGLMAVLRRRKAEPAVLEFEAPIVPAPAPAPAPEPASARATAPVRESASSPVLPPTMPALPHSLAIALEAKRMSASLMATTLSYALTVTNNSPDTLSALAIEGDMIAAHASLPPEQQIASSAQRLELRHALVTLAPGESAEFTGDFRLPLTSLTPIRAGDAAYFVPLARLRVAASTPAGQPLVQVQTFVVGEQGDAADAGLRPFRLDLGPRTYSRLSQRAVS